MSTLQYSEDPKLRTAQKVVFWVVIGLGGIVLFGLLFGLVIQFLWNMTLAAMFDLPSISFWQAVGVFILAKLLFGFGGSSSSSSGKKSRSSKKSMTCESLEPERADAAEDAVVIEVTDLASDQQFRRFWDEQGKDAYEAWERERDLGRDPE